jgi:tetratricopeptide (TPR) repeat protein
MWWLENQSKAPVAPTANPTSIKLSGAQSSPSVPALENVPKTQSHLPPSQLTAGMSARQAALTLANWYYDHHQHELAVKSFRRAIQLGVTHPHVRTDLGNALRLNGQPQEALKQYQLAQLQDPVHEPSLFNQGALYATSLNNPKKAVEVWRMYLKRFPKGTQAAQATQLITKYSAK